MKLHELEKNIGATHAKKRVGRGSGSGLGKTSGLEKYNLDFAELCDMYELHSAIYLDSLPRGSFDTPVRHLSSFKCQSFVGNHHCIGNEFACLPGKQFHVAAGCQHASLKEVAMMADDVQRLCADRKPCCVASRKVDGVVLFYC